MSHVEMKGYQDRYYDRVSWTARKTNQWILESWSNKNFVSKYKDNEITLFWTHHETHNCIEKDIIQETLSGKRQRQRQHNMSWLGTSFSGQTWT